MGQDHVILEDEFLRAVIATRGGWLERLDSKVNGPILFPKQPVVQPDGSEKVRGGCHVCVPNFGPGGATELPQHGYGRTADWRIVEATSRLLRLSLASGMHGYEALSHELTYRLTGRKIELTLSVANGGDMPLAISPGFHPYFYAERELVILLDNETISDDIAEAVLLEKVPGVLTIGTSTYRLATEHLGHWVLWSDNCERYVCVEPTAAAFSFADKRAQLLSPGQRKEWNFSIEEEL